MSKRYMGNEEITSQSQLIRYLQDNYVDSEGDPMPEATAIKLVADADQDKISSAIRVFRSHVSYVGDEILNAADVPYAWLDDSDEDYEDDE